MAWKRRLLRWRDTNATVYLDVQLNLAYQAKYFRRGGFGMIGFVAKLSMSSHMVYLDFAVAQKHNSL